jgi:hypothetical protein
MQRSHVRVLRKVPFMVNVGSRTGLGLVTFRFFCDGFPVVLSLVTVGAGAGMDVNERDPGDSDDFGICLTSSVIARLTA